MNSAQTPFRPIAAAALPFGRHRDGQGQWRLDSAVPLEPPPPRLLDRLVSGSRQHPERTLVAQRDAQGIWQSVTYADMLARVRALAQGLSGLGLSVERPLLILSGNSIEHLTLAYAAQYAGIPVAAVAPNYSLASTDFVKLRQVVQKLTPGAVYTDDPARYAAAIEALRSPDRVVIGVDRSHLPGHTCIAELSAKAPSTVDAQFAATGADTIAKFLFTSGSTGTPKAVPITQGMWCANQQMLRQTFPFLAQTPPVLLDWMPWSHSFGSNFTTGLALYNGGSFYIDDGGPTQERFQETLRNLREISPTLYVSVPRMWAYLVDALETEPALCRTFFARMGMFFFGAAALSEAVAARLDRVAATHCGERIGMFSGLGMTEVCSVSTFTTSPALEPGWIGSPAPGCGIKLVPRNGRLEARFRGPNVMPGYWRASADDTPPFDEEGYYISGDAVRWRDAARPESGLVFDGRLAENFKLSSGTFVNVAEVRSRALAMGDPYVADVVVTAPDQSDLGLLVFPRLEACRALAALPAHAEVAAVLAAPAVLDFFGALLSRLMSPEAGSAGRITRLRLLAEPASPQEGEITEKGSINQRLVLTRRAADVAALYREPTGSVTATSSSFQSIQGART